MKIIIINSVKHGVKEVLCDDEDYEKATLFKWHVCKSKDTFYAASQTPMINGVRSKILMHRYLTNQSDGKIEVDHKDHNGLNNQRSNLRVCVDGQNKRNRNKNKSSLSKYIGVRLKTVKVKSGIVKKWQANIECKGVCKTGRLYPFTDDGERMAAIQRDEMAIKYFREFANLNFK